PEAAGYEALTREGGGLQAGGGDARSPAGLRSGVQSRKEGYRHAGHGALNRTAAAIKPCDKPDDYWAWFGPTRRMRSRAGGCRPGRADIARRGLTAPIPVGIA